MNYVITLHVTYIALKMFSNPFLYSDSHLVQGGKKFYPFLLISKHINENSPTQFLSMPLPTSTVYVLKGRKKSCNACYQQDCKLSTCGGCRRTFYCTRQCQEKNRKSHKEFCFHILNEQKIGYCFVVTQIPILKYEWKWICKNSIELIKSGKVHPDDIFFNTATSEEANYKHFSSCLVDNCIDQQDLEMFDYLLKCGAGKTSRIGKAVCKNLKSYSSSTSIPLRYKFILKWLEMKFDLPIKQDIELCVMEIFIPKYLQWMKMWIDDLGVPINFIFTTNSVYKLIFPSAYHLKKYSLQKDVCNFIFSNGFTPPREIEYYDMLNIYQNWLYNNDNDVTDEIRHQSLVSYSDIINLNQCWFQRNTVITELLESSNLFNVLIHFIMSFI